ncbi:MFS transporter [Sulfurifustis variabilis]|uniref:MFS transporter n=1 Tax=Sulfurifustis variabilis TaxID=1675686 RepID=A0A1C7AF56_9GAMM|nr:MFS transporter [Sulfurifustis variabilis]BAU49878.1 MFS transporter [Sulfurifustis variabilis]
MRPRARPLTPLERRSVAGLAGIFATRLLGLFLILPVFALYAEGLSGYTPFLAGLALGVYGLTQAFLQIPFGMLSDRLGRKPVIAVGLLLFAVGSAIAALADSIAGVIVGRALQGAGAISAAVVALVADLTREEVRTKAMAIIGITVGASFLGSLLLGPALDSVIGVPGIFWLTAGLAGVGLAVLFGTVPTPTAGPPAGSRRPVRAEFLLVLRDPALLRLDIGIFVLHAVLTATFVVLPMTLVRYAGLPGERHWSVYLPLMLASVVFLFPLIAAGERPRGFRPVFAGSVLALALAQGALYLGHSELPYLLAALFLFFTGFNVLEASLPSLISRTAPSTAKGAAIGIYSTFQFFGAFVGGAAAGWMHGRFGLASVYAGAGALLAVWFLVAVFTPPPARLTTRTLQVGRRAPAEARDLASRLAAIPGVAEATVIADEGVAYLKVDDTALDDAALERYSTPA